MKHLTDLINQLKTEFEQHLATISDESALESFYSAFLGRKGKLAALTDQFKQLSLEDKRTFGPQLQTLKEWCNTEYEKQKLALKQAATDSLTEKKKQFDVTSYKPLRLQGSLHVYTHLIQQLESIFITMGYEPVDGPELETDYYNFQALNIAEDHPAREHMDTFWLHLPNMLMRTHTSTVQIHAMEQKKLPLALVSIGRAYRNEATDASHDFMFTQVEGLVVDKGISIADLLGTAQAFLQQVFEDKKINIRMRPGYFPFVEPGIEIDCSCPFCTTGCSTCKYTGWIELMGSGLVHPNVLQCCGIDSSVYSGFAFGMGLERLAMIKYGINDIRLFRSNTLSFLSQF